MDFEEIRGTKLPWYAGALAIGIGENRFVSDEQVNHLKEKLNDATTEELAEAIQRVENQRARYIRNEEGKTDQDKEKEFNKLVSPILDEQHKRKKKGGSRRKRKSTRRSRKSRTTRRRRFLI